MTPEEMLEFTKAMEMLKQIPVDHLQALKNVGEFSTANNIEQAICRLIRRVEETNGLLEKMLGKIK